MSRLLKKTCMKTAFFLITFQRPPSFVHARPSMLCSCQTCLADPQLTHAYQLQYIMFSFNVIYLFYLLKNVVASWAAQKLGSMQLIKLFPLLTVAPLLTLQLERAYSVCGTIEYMAPEIVEGGESGHDKVLIHWSSPYFISAIHSACLVTELMYYLAMCNKYIHQINRYLLLAGSGLVESWGTDV